MTVSNLYLPQQRDAVSHHYTALETDITNCIQHIIDSQDSIFTDDVNGQ